MYINHVIFYIYFPIKYVVRTNGGFTELLLSDLIGYVCSHKDGHCDAQLSFDHLRDQPQSLWALIYTLQETTTNRMTSTTNLIQIGSGIAYLILVGGN